VTCVSSSDCWAVGEYYIGASRTLIEHWDGTAWTIVTSPNDPTAVDSFLNGVTCASASECWAVGYSYNTVYQALIAHWNGILWTLSVVGSPASSEPSVLYSTTCTSASDCWAVGYTSTIQQTLIQHWNGLLWTVVTSPNTSPTQYNRLNNVTCVSTSDCWAVGYASGGKQQTLTQHWDGTSWAIVASLNTSATQHNVLNSVICSSGSNCWAAGTFFTGTNYQTLIEQWNGTAWAIVESPNTNTSKSNILNGVTCGLASECWVVGQFYTGSAYRTLIQRFDGTSWTITTSANTSTTPNNRLFDVACMSGSDCWAAGISYSGSDYQTLIERWDGTSWSIVPSPDPSATRDNVLFGVTCVSSAECWAVGFTFIPNGAVPRTLVVHWDGTAWAVVTSPNTSAVQANTLESVTCVSSSDCWAVGYWNAGDVQQTVIQRWNGTSWTIVASPNPSSEQIDYLSDVGCASGSDCWAVGASWIGTNYQTMIVHWDGTAWTVVSSPNTSGSDNNLLDGVTCASASDCWAVGHSLTSNVQQTLVEHWDGTSWSIVASPNTSTTENNLFNEIACTSDSNCWAVGLAGTVEQTLIEHWDGTSWTIATSPNAAQSNILLGVTCDAPWDCWAVGEHGLVDAYQTLALKFTGPAPPLPTKVVSRKQHGSAGTFDVDLPLTGDPGVECRSGGANNDYRVVFTFPTAVTFGDATITLGSGGTGRVSGSTTSPDGTEITVNLTEVSNVQTLILNLSGLNDGTTTGDVRVPMSILIGDVNETRRTDSGDVTLVRNHTVSIPDATTFRFDVNASGRIDAGDVTVTRNASVTVLP
jgi:hypothetical protein